MGAINDKFGERIVLGLLPGKYDRITRTATDSVTDTWEYFLQDVSVGIIVIVYSTTAKNEINSIQRTA